MKSSSTKKPNLSHNRNNLPENRRTKKLPEVLPVKMAEEKSKPAAAAAAAADIDQSAEDFIMKFRNQLMIQRMESIDNYHKMLARGT
ncbi:Protein of unknown function DUF761, plant [Cynara cardunculus var. scolymus]|uniref:DUF761 domain-containing protein n=1 Tax=Cynara cardunculus var. scolymus TaxID=59895 RepID=A0A103XLP9_CYNCS|nr:Protein of unknown function DUF761, plant [Cynara cardunculus var. scolymus]